MQIRIQLQSQNNKELIKRLLLQYKVLTALDMFYDYQIIDIRKPISDLIKEGMNIKKQMIWNGKKHYKKYWLDQDNKQLSA